MKKTSKPREILGNAMHHPLVAGLLGGSCLVASGHPSEAAIVLTIPPTPIHAGVFPDEPAAEIDLNDDNVLDFVIPGSFSQIDVYPQGSNRALSVDDLGTLYAVELSAASFIGADPGEGRVWAAGSPVMAACFSGGGLCDGDFLGGIGYLGAEFDIAGNTHYGWLEIRSRERTTFIDVLSWAYESEPGVGILAGAIPEPSPSLMLLAASVLTLRRRRRTKAPASSSILDQRPPEAPPHPPSSNPRLAT